MIFAVTPLSKTTVTPCKDINWVCPVNLRYYGMLKTRICFLTSLFCFSFFNLQFAQEVWELEAEQDGITVFTRDVPNKKYKEFKATTVVDASMHSLLALFKSVEKMPEWLSNCADSELLQSQDFWHQISYLELDVPVLRNRDMILEMNIVQDTVLNAMRIDMQSRPDLHPEMKRKIRIHDISGYWICKPLDNGKMYIEYSMYVDPSGIIPAWLYNKKIKNDPIETLSNLKNALDNQHFQSAYFHELQAVLSK